MRNKSTQPFGDWVTNLFYSENQKGTNEAIIGTKGNKQLIVFIDFYYKQSEEVPQRYPHMFTSKDFLNVFMQ